MTTGLDIDGRVMTSLWWIPAQTAREISERLQISPSIVLAALQRLRADGLTQTVGYRGDTTDLVWDPRRL